MEKLLKLHFEAIKARGLIIPETNIGDFIDKMDEELNEIKNTSNIKELLMEATDLAAVCFNLIQFLGYDPIELYRTNVLTQEKRAKK